MASDRPIIRVSFAFASPRWCQDFVQGTGGDLGQRIDAMCRAIQDMWRRETCAGGGAADPDAISIANDNLRERVYFMMFWLREIGKIDEARMHMRRGGRRGRRPKSDAATAFVDVLHHVFRDEGGEAVEAVSSQSRPRIARELAYALHHNIPPVLLLPFLRHATQAEILRRQKLGIVEDWLQTDTAA